MKQEIEEDTVIRRYLMGNLEEGEQLEVEERLFLDSQYTRMLQAVEDDLIDDYLYGELSPDERSRFEKYFLSTPERHQALKVAEALKHYIAANPLAEPAGLAQETESPSPSQATFKATFMERLRAALPSWRLPLAAAALLLITISALWLVYRALKTTDRPAPVQAQRPAQEEKQEARQPAQDSQPGRAPQSNTGATPAPEEQYAEGGRDKAAPGSQREQAQTATRNRQAREQGPAVRRAPTPVYSFMLIPGGATRGEGGADLGKVALRSRAGSVNLQLILLGGGDFPAYRATLFTDDNQPVRSWTGLRSTAGESGKFVSVEVPAALLRQQATYHVKLSGDSSGAETRDISSYYFQVVK